MKLALTVALLLACAPLQAQDMPDGTVDVYFQQLSSDGKLDGCSLVFTSLVRDFATQRGTQFIVNGSIAIRKLGPEQLMLTGKLGTRPFLAQNEWQPPAHFFFATSNRSTAGRAKIADSDTPGYKLLLAPMDTELIRFLEELGKSGQFTAGFNRRAGGQDIATPIKLNVRLKKDANGNAVRLQNDETQADFFGCLGKLF
jgi:hypothetical protein